MRNKQIKIIHNALDWGYNTVVGDKNPLKNAYIIAEEYLKLYKCDKIAAAKRFISNREKYCFTSGFLTGLCGLITLPVAIPASLASLIYLQIFTNTNRCCYSCNSRKRFKK